MNPLRHLHRNLTPIRVLGLLFVMQWTIGIAACGDSKSPTAPPVTNQSPAVPALDAGSGAPANGATAIALSTTLRWSCSDPDGDELRYTVRFGAASPPPIVSTDQTGTSYSPTGMLNDTTYYWQIVAKDLPDGATAESAVWSFTTVAAVTTESVSAPSPPSGPTNGEIGQSVTYIASGASSTLSHAIQYRFDWGDGSMSTWSADTSIAHSWTVAGSYEVKSQARCSIHVDIESGWSVARLVEILDTETNSVPDAPTGPASAETNTTVSFTTTGATNSRGHTLQYRFDWDQGLFSNWQTELTSSHSWTSAGTYDVRVKARCQSHPTIESEWSAPTSIEIVLPAETIESPGRGAGALGPVAGAVGVEQTFTINWTATSNLGHPVEHQFDWGDGNMGAWGTSLIGTHTWDTVGTYTVRIRGRCIEHPTAVSDWSLSDPIEITDATEVITQPHIQTYNKFYAYALAIIYATNATSNIGDPLEFRMDLDADGITEWQSGSSFQHYFEHDGSMNLRVQARCQLHPDVITEWSPDAFKDVAEANKAMDEPTGPTNAVTGEELTFTALPTVNSSGHPLEYNFYFQTSTSGWTGPNSGWGTALTASHIYDTTGQKVVKVRSRCTLHPDIYGNSVYHLVYVTAAP